MKVPNTYVIIFAVLFLCAVATWLVPGAEPQTWQLFSALFEGFSSQADIIAFVLIIGGAFWIVNSTRAVDAGILEFIAGASRLERFPLVGRIGIGNIIIVLVMLLFGVFGAVFGMSEETIAFVAVLIPLAKSLGYDEFTGVFMVYLAAHVGFAGAMLNPFTVGIAQDMSGLPLFSGIGYRTLCWVVLMTVAIAWVLWYASRHKTSALSGQETAESGSGKNIEAVSSGRGALCVFIIHIVALAVFSILYAGDCVIKIGEKEFSAPWLMWCVSGLYLLVSIPALLRSRQMYILDMLIFTIVFIVVGVMGYGWYLPEICALFMALGISAGVSAGYSPDRIASEFVSGAKDIFSAALVIGLAAGIIVILQNGNVIDPMLNSMASLLKDSGRTGALTLMYGLQTFINIFIPSASAKAAVTMPVMAPFSDMIGLSRQATVLAFQFGDGFTNMITPCSGVLMAVLSVARIPYERWFRTVWKFILLLILLGFLLLLPAALFPLPGF